jgi:hypothetical protein
MVINGHLAWTCQNASGNRGDDFRALKLCEMQPYTWLHPNKETAVYSVLGLQGEEKSGKQGMKTVGVSFFYSCTILIHLTCTDNQSVVFNIHCSSATGGMPSWHHGIPSALPSQHLQINGEYED